MRRSKILILICSVFTLTMLAAMRCVALEPMKQKKFAILEERVRVDFLPTQAFFLVEFNEIDVERFEAVITPPFEFQEKQSFPSAWYFGTRVPLRQGVESLTYALIVAGNEQGFTVTPAKRWWREAGSPALESLDERRQRLLHTKSVLRSLEMQLTELQESVKRLNSDAEIIGNLGRIVEKKEEIEKAKQDIIQIEKVIASLKTFVALASSRAEPARFLTRENMLNKQLPELSEAVKRIEADEMTRKLAAEKKRQDTFSLIESARFEDLNKLVGDFEKLKRRRELLEQRLGAVTDQRMRIDEYPQ